MASSPGRPFRPDPPVDRLTPDGGRFLVSTGFAFGTGETTYQPPGKPAEPQTEEVMQKSQLLTNPGSTIASELAKYF